MRGAHILVSISFLSRLFSRTLADTDKETNHIIIIIIIIFFIIIIIIVVVVVVI